jgi:hypothetical protein
MLKLGCEKYFCMLTYGALVEMLFSLYTIYSIAYETVVVVGRNAYPYSKTRLLEEEKPCKSKSRMGTHPSKVQGK